MGLENPLHCGPVLGGEGGVNQAIGGAAYDADTTQEVRIEILKGLKWEVWLAWNPWVLRIRTALDNLRQVLSQIFRWWLAVVLSRAAASCGL